MKKEVWQILQFPNFVKKFGYIPGLGTEIKMNIDIDFSINVIHVLNIDINFGITEIQLLNIDINFDISKFRF